MPAPQAFQSRKLYDYLWSFPSGVNNNLDYTQLDKNTLASGVNTTVRGSFVGPRPRFRKMKLQAGPYGADTMLSIMKAGRYQFGCYFRPDTGSEGLMASISGHLYRFDIFGDTATVADVSVPGSLNDPDQPRNWLWQSEKWVIVTDGTPKVPIFYDVDAQTSRRSNWGTQTNFTDWNVLATDFKIPAVGGTVLNVQVHDNTNMAVGDIITVNTRGTCSVQRVDVDGIHVDLLSINMTPVGLTLVAHSTTNRNLSWRHTTGFELPAGRMGAYGKGRNWMALGDGKQFVAGDIVGGSSGTPANNFRDAVLNITENLFLFGGGNFAIPGAYGDIRAMCFDETLDASLGQGPLQVFTPTTVFSCDAPVDRTQWQSVQNPILTESAKGGGGLSQWSTINSNSDIISRAFDGIRSLILARREFNTWGNVPISQEIRKQLDRDSMDLLGYTSAVVFDNRQIMTTEGVPVDGRGIIWKRMAITNYDPISSLRGKAPSVYDALYWQGLDVFQLIVGEIDEVPRCFAFTLNQITGEIELWEILRSADPEIYDEGPTRVVWSFESPVIDFGQKDPRIRERLRLNQAEISVKDLKGKVSFRVAYKPEHWPCWVPWAEWEECADNTDSESRPDYRPVMGLPQPSGDFCDVPNNRPLREAYFYQVKVEVSGQCTFTGMRVSADTVPQPDFAPPVCDALCDTSVL